LTSEFKFRVVSVFIRGLNSVGRRIEATDTHGSNQPRNNTDQHLNRTGLVGGPIQREDGTHGTTQQVRPRIA